MKDLIDRNEIVFYCSYNGDCMADKEKCKTCSDYVCSYEDIYNLENCIKDDE